MLSTCRRLRVHSHPGGAVLAHFTDEVFESHVVTRGLGYF